MVTLLKLTENDKRLIIVLLLLVILVFVIAGYIGILVKKIMDKQGKKMDDLIHDVVVAGVITDRKHLIRFGIKKNHRQLFKDAWLPFSIMAFASFIIILYCIIYQNWNPSFLSDYESTGFNTLFFVFDWKNAPRSTFFGKEIISGWPTLLSKPHFSWKAWGAYLFFPGMIGGALWFLICIQAYIARTIRLFKKSKEVFSKSLENYNVNEVSNTPQNPIQ
ncbi:MAG: hypothetical protein K6E11_02100 [Bacilli bacterium]|nr:hypothetical protein [Bacilli bacterium]